MFIVIFEVTYFILIKHLWKKHRIWVCYGLHFL